MTDEVRDEEVRGPERPATERAEELVDLMARGAGYLVSSFGLRVLKGASLAREEAEDIWAEAQSLRHHQRQSAEPDVYEPDMTGPEEAGEEVPETIIRVTEAARLKAEELDVDLAEIPGTGVGGQITVEDVKKRAKAGSS